VDAFGVQGLLWPVATLSSHHPHFRSRIAAVAHYNRILIMTFTNIFVRSSLRFSFAGLFVGLLASACDLPDKNLGDDPAGTTGGSCEPGETMMQDCNTCSCEDGQWACTEIGCDPTGGSADGGETCDPSQDPSDDCNSCSCEDGQWACTQIGCEGTTGHIDFDCDPAEDLTDECVTCECLASGEWLCSDEACVHPVELCQDTDPTDPLFVTDASITGDTLSLSVESSGGCESHEYGSCWDGSFAESDPVQAGLRINHENNDDPCEAIVTAELTIDLTSMRDAWIDAYQQPSGTIIVQLAGWGPLDYSF
jgi:hypothetical protein